MHSKYSTISLATAASADTSSPIGYPVDLSVQFTGLTNSPITFFSAQPQLAQFDPSLGTHSGIFPWAGSLPATPSAVSRPSGRDPNAEDDLWTAS
jgi:hypothetical protein